MNETEKSELVMPRGDELVLSSSPHVRTAESVPAIMGKVMLALLPAVVAAVVFFGWDALRVIVLTIAFCVGAEALWCRLAGRPVWGTIRDGSAALTGLLLALNLSAAVPFYVCLVGAFLAIWLGKQVYGGLGHNPFNPALVARVGLLIALPAAMTTWAPSSGMTPERAAYAKIFFSDSDWGKVEAGQADAVTCATPLGVVKTTPKVLGRDAAAKTNFASVDNPDARKQYFLGNLGGCLGEVSALALLLGGVMLVCFRLINWRVPVVYVGTVAVITGLVHYFHPGVTPTPLFHVLTGGLLLGAIFMATDMVTSPMSCAGCVVFAVGCGVITSVIRIWGNYPEGVSFSILFMNALVPLIDRVCVRYPFGYVRKREVSVK
jgi:electron transport complex protein RnfD